MITPMISQYNKIKEKYKDAILFFRLGDFYEMFDMDANEASELLDLTMTHRNGHPMCGIPHHSAMLYIKRLLEKGRKIAICEQLSSSDPSSKLLDRAVTEVYTPGMIIEDELLDNKSNNFLMIAHSCAGRFQVAYADYSTGYMGVSFSHQQESVEFLQREILRLSPKEVLLEEALYDDMALRSWISSNSKRTASLPNWYFDVSRATKSILRHFKVSHLNALGFMEEDTVHIPLGVLLEYLSQNMASVNHFKTFNIYTGENSLFMDESTIRNLEIIKNIREGDSKFSLLNIMDNTQTGMGIRLLHQWLLSPSINRMEIQKRLDAVGCFTNKPSFMRKVRSILTGMRDLERLAIRLSIDKAHARDLFYIAGALEKVDQIMEIFNIEGVRELPFLSEEKMCELKKLRAEILEAIHGEPSATFTVGNLIRTGYNEELDNLRDLEKNRRERLQEYLDREKIKTGIATLKLKYNKVIGYHFEVSRNQSDLVPDYFIKRQTFISGIRYTTEELAILEQAILSTEDKGLALERSLFFSFRNTIKGFSSLILEAAGYIALWDVYSNLSYVALEQDFICPIIEEAGTGIQIKKGRHPVVEYYKDFPFIPNDLSLSKENRYFAFVTGPNMAGKSTYLRQIAIIILLAQMGSFVPASFAQIGLVDKIFCRVGASDNLARGESTFLVEMNETSFILRNATPYSLVILDEVGRGTSTYDGLAIAWSVSEYLLNTSKSFTLFATHYHELAILNDSRIHHLSLAVQIKGDDIIFLRYVQDKPSLSSYGIPVAKLAGLPLSVISRAKDILNQLEKKNCADYRKVDDSVGGLVLGEIEEALKMFNEMKLLDVNRLTPLEAITIISKWKRKWE